MEGSNEKVFGPQMIILKSRQHCPEISYTQKILGSISTYLMAPCCGDLGELQRLTLNFPLLGQIRDYNYTNKCSEIFVDV